MAEYVEKTLFERALLASRLVDATELVEVAQRLPEDPPGFGEDSDNRLAERLVERGVLNAWQVEQLRAGRTKFTLGPYLIVDAIAKGGMGHLFKGRHELLGRVEAIKVLPKSRSTPHAIASFQHEIRAQAQLEHPNLVRVSYAGQDGDTHFLVTEFVPGVDLRRLVRRMGPLPADQAAALLAQVADALDYAHRRGLVHRDVKPGNLLVQTDGIVKVTDLGLAWRLEDGYGATAGKGKIVGTCDFLAPEAITAPDRIIPVSDIYALGCTLYYAVTGKVPFPGGNPSSKMRRQMNDEPIDPRALSGDLPDGMADLIGHMMQKDHRERTPTAQAVARRLREFVTENSLSDVAEVAKQCAELPLSTRLSSGDKSSGAPAGFDIGETIVSLSDAALPAGIDDPRDSHSAASQCTEPIAGASQETLPTATPAVPRDTAVTGPAQPTNQTVRLVVAAALGATGAILAATILRFL